MTELSNLISRLSRGIARNASYIKTIRHPQLLLISLQELNDLIGNDKVKDSVATQVSHLIMIRRRAIENTGIKEDEVMLNTVLYGPPGVGKTLIGAKLAKIWYSLGYLDSTNNSKDKKHEFGDLMRDLFKDSAGSSGSTDDTALTLYVTFIFIVIFITFLSIMWSFYSRFGGAITLVLIGLIIFIILCVGYYISVALNNNNNSNSSSSKKGKNNNRSGCADGSCNRNNNNNKNNVNDISVPSTMDDIPSDEQIIKIVTRADFVGQYVGWTSPKTNKLLAENIGKVIFVDEAYSLINGPHDEFGMEALTSLNLFLSQHPKETIVIFAGYKDLLESGPYAVQPGLKRRFMWQFDCDGYNPEQLFRIFKMQLNKKGWDLSDDESVINLFVQNMDAFPAFGGDTERAAFFSELEHSREFINNEDGLKINILETRHIKAGINKLRDNNFKETDHESSNPLANMMRMMSGKKKESTQNSSADDQELIALMRQGMSERAYQ